MVRTPKTDDIKEIFHMLFANWIPFPDRAYCEKMGWEFNRDGTVDTPGGWRIPTRELCETKELEKLYEVSELEHLYNL
jgi:hypothetical protein